MSRKNPYAGDAENFTQVYVSALMRQFEPTFVTKSADGGMAVDMEGFAATEATLTAAIEPVAEFFMGHVSEVHEQSAKSLKKLQKRARNVERMIKAITAPGPAVVSPMRLPARQRQIDFRPTEWDTRLVPQHPINGAHYAEAADTLTSADPTSGHPG